MVLKSLEKHRVCFGDASPPFADRATSAQTYSFGEFPLVLLLTLRKFSFCSHSVVHDFLLLFCCYCSTLQHCFPLNVRKLYYLVQTHHHARRATRGRHTLSKPRIVQSCERCCASTTLSACSLTPPSRPPRAHSVPLGAHSMPNAKLHASERPFA